MSSQLFVSVPIWGTSRCDDVPVEQKDCPLWWQLKGLSFTASGYGAKIPTRCKVCYLGKWYRVYCKIYSNSGTCFIVGKFGTATTHKLRVF